MSRDRKSSGQTLTLLAILMDLPKRWRHGYELSKQTQLKSGTLYPILMRLGDRGLLESAWEPSEHAGRPPRRMHRLTGKGVSFAREQLVAIAPVTQRAPQQSRA